MRSSGNSSDPSSTAPLRRAQPRDGEHRTLTDEAHLQDALNEMRGCLNELIPRRSLGWCTPAQRWDQRPDLRVDRAAFRDEVGERAERIAATLSDEERSLAYDQRFPIERTLEKRGMLRVRNEGWC